MPFADINGTQLFYLEVGRGWPCLVMHGGCGFDHTLLHPWLDPLCDILRLIYYDHRGNGRSGRPPLETLTFEQFADDADSLRQHLGIDKIAVVGHSFGGHIALHYALRYPQYLTHLILLDTAPAWDYTDEIVANAKRKGATPDMLALLDFERCATDDDLKKGIRRLAPLYYHHFDLELAERLFGKVIFTGAALRRGGQLLKSYNIADRLKDITAPTLIMTGKDDFITPPSQADRLKHGIPRSTLVILEESGHFPYAEQPEEFFRAVRSWLETVART